MSDVKNIPDPGDVKALVTEDGRVFYDLAVLVKAYRVAIHNDNIEAYSEGNKMMQVYLSGQSDVIFGIELDIDSVRERAAD